MENAGEAFASAFRDPQWVSKFLLMGLIGIIPIVGQMNLYGWALTVADYRRAGYWGLPPAGFGYIGRGAPTFLTVLVYGLLFAALYALTLGPMLLALLAGGADHGSHPYQLLAGGGFTGVYSLISLLALAFQFLLPGIIVHVEQGGVAGGLNVVRIVQVTLARPGPMLMAGLLYYVSSLLAGIGLLLCCVGIIFTIPYTYVALGELVFRLERALGYGPPPNRSLPAPPPGPSWPAPGY